MSLKRAQKVLPWVRTGTKTISFGAGGKVAQEKSGVVNTCQRGFTAELIDDSHLGCLRKIGPNHLPIVFAMTAEIVEGVGVTSFDDGAAFG